ncbi:hypothetical protein [Cupriavidus pinatubonensis]|jgi:hypothetical protein|uniref:Uncharacterized protein n=1 Tax=Cupriavidus pinatubonensis TaxID=248026 RepID=A0ABN7ZAU5_9BURK|nr:hypothetical protein [Cupriavidus pinatubonensis]CAG9182070.1 hypothetical protein LMG23994_04807 [Cupriavidus pinatubonensis]
MANKQLGTRQKLVFRGGTGSQPPPRGKGTVRKSGPPQTSGKSTPPRQPRKLIGSSDS